MAILWMDDNICCNGARGKEDGSNFPHNLMQSNVTLNAGFIVSVNHSLALICGHVLWLDCFNTSFMPCARSKFRHVETVGYNGFHVPEFHKMIELPIYMQCVHNFALEGDNLFIGI